MTGCPLLGDDEEAAFDLKTQNTVPYYSRLACALRVPEMDLLARAQERKGMRDTESTDTEIEQPPVELGWRVALDREGDLAFGWMAFMFSLFGDGGLRCHAAGFPIGTAS